MAQSAQSTANYAKSRADAAYWDARDNAFEIGSLQLDLTNPSSASRSGYNYDGDAMLISVRGSDNGYASLWAKVCGTTVVRDRDTAGGGGWSVGSGFSVIVPPGCSYNVGGMDSITVRRQYMNIR